MEPKTFEVIIQRAGRSRTLSPKGQRRFPKMIFSSFFLNNEEITLNSSLQVDKDISDLIAVETRYLESPFVFAVDLVADPLADDTHKSGRFFDAYHFLKSAAQFAIRSARGAVSVTTPSSSVNSTSSGGCSLCRMMYSESSSSM